MIDTSAIGLHSAPPARGDAGGRIQSEFDRDRDANGHYEPGGGGTGHGPAGDERAPGGREERDRLELSAASGDGGAGLLLSRIVANIARSLSAAPAAARARRALLDVYTRPSVPSAVDLPSAAPPALTADEAAVRIALLAGAAETAPSPAATDARHSRIARLLTCLDTEVARALADAPPADPAHAEALRRLPTLVQTRLTA